MLNSVTMIQKISILPPQQGLELPRNGEGWGFCKPPPPKKKKKEMCEAKFNWNFQRCWGVFYRRTEVWAFSVTTCLYICCNCGFWRCTMLLSYNIINLSYKISIPAFNICKTGDKINLYIGINAE